MEKIFTFLVCDVYCYYPSDNTVENSSETLDLFPNKFPNWYKNKKC